MPNVAKNDCVSFRTGDRSILGKGKNACWGRPDANALMFESGGRESVLLNIEVQGLNRVNRMTQQLAPSLKDHGQRHRNIQSMRLGTSLAERQQRSRVRPDSAGTCG